MRKFLLLLILNGSVILGFSQQDAQFSQYMFNPFVLNPAYAGCRQAFTALAIHRDQWIKIPGAPSTQTLSLNSPLSKNVGLGLQVFNDEIGPKNTIGYLGSYSYRIPLSKGKIAFGLRAGGLTYNFNWDKIEFKDPQDIYNYSNRTQTTIFNVDFGMFYHTKTFYTGLSINHLGDAKRTTPAGIDGIENHLLMHLFYTLGNTFEISEKFALQPALLLKFVEHAPVHVDMNLNLIINQRIWMGLSFRPGNAVVLLSQFLVTDKFRFGYSYDIGINRMRGFSAGSNEIYIGYDFNLRKARSLSPRYF